MGDVLPVHATRAGLLRGFLRLAPRMLQVLQVQQTWCFPNGEVAAKTGSLYKCYTTMIYAYIFVYIYIEDHYLEMLKWHILILGNIC